MLIEFVLALLLGVSFNKAGIVGKGIVDESKTRPDAIFYKSLGDEARYEVNYEIE